MTLLRPDIRISITTGISGTEILAPSKIKIVIGCKVDFLDFRLSDLMKLEDGPNQVTIPCSLKYAAFKR